MLGPPPLDLLKRGVRSQEFFTEDGKSSELFIDFLAHHSCSGEWKADVPIPQGTSLERSEEYLGGNDKEQFLDFVRSMLQWRLEDRKAAEQLHQDPWLHS